MRKRVHELALKDQKQVSRFDATKNLIVQLARLDVIEATKEKLMALAVQIGLRVIQAMMQEEVDESANEKMRMASRNVKHWGNGEQVLCWAEAGFLEAEKKLRTVKGFRQIPVLIKTLYKCVHPEQRQEK